MTLGKSQKPVLREDLGPGPCTLPNGINLIVCFHFGGQKCVEEAARVRAGAQRC